MFNRDGKNPFWCRRNDRRGHFAMGFSNDRQRSSQNREKNQDKVTCACVRTGWSADLAPQVGDGPGLFFFVTGKIKCRLLCHVTSKHQQ